MCACSEVFRSAHESSACRRTGGRRSVARCPSEVKGAWRSAASGRPRCPSIRGCPRDSGRAALIALSPLDLADGVCIGKEPLEELGGAVVVSACVARPLRVGGWDSLARRPLPLRSVLPRIAVLNDDDFAWFVRYGLCIQARNVLDDDGSKRSRNLWYEETLPPDTVMYALVMGRSPGALGMLDELFPETDPYLQVGGNETVGQGWFAVSVRRGGDPGGPA